SDHFRTFVFMGGRCPVMSLDIAILIYGFLMFGLIAVLQFVILSNARINNYFSIILGLALAVYGLNYLRILIAAKRSTP
ncbi:MAG: hypothetical protein ACQESG_04510, partial [Nanobdellota archaeon]